jgi:hypothetical protein
LAWARFTAITASYGDLQGRVIATIFYFTILAPFGIAVTLFSDPLGVRAKARPAWAARPAVDSTPEGAARQG